MIARDLHSNQSLLTEPERAQLLVEFNATHTPYPSRRCTHQLFQEQVQRTPNALAVECEGHTLTYGQLNARANQLAHYLRALGVGPEVLVGVCLERSLDMLVGLLAILKAGGAYLPLDPAWPKTRLTLIADNAHLSLLLTTNPLHQRLPDTNAHALFLDEPTLQDALDNHPQTDPLGRTHPHNLAYVLHTSGSTGTPKGVAISQRALVNFLTSMARAPGVSATDVLVAVTTLSFDIAGLELYLPLLVGARVVIASREVVTDGPRLGALLAGSGATLMQATPSTWRMLLSSGWQGGAGLRVLCGGEALGVELGQRLVERCGEVWNLYGPTETTIWSSVWEVERGADGSVGVVRIGRPISNTQMYVLDGEMEPVGLGVCGELYIGGDGLARGYLGRGELTAERFVPDPFGGELGGRLYRTGDLARWLGDGTLEYVGRVDHQVKVRGFRIELGEIESVLLAHPGVREAVVLAREDTSGDKRLVGYLVAPAEESLGDLRSFLRARLPEYMVPGAFVRLDALPLTLNGKVDRSALPAPENGRVAVTSDLVEPRTPTEKWLVETWQAHLGINPIGICDSFFEIGGHSLMAARIFDRIHKQLGRGLSPATLFQAPTIEALAAILDQEDWKPDWKCLVAIHPGGTRPPFFCIHGAGANLFFCEILARYMPQDLPFYGLQSLGLDGRDEPLTRVEDMAELYLREIQSVQPAGPYYLGGFSLGGVIALEMAQRLHAQGQEVGLLAMINSDCPVRSPHLPRRSWLFEYKIAPMAYQAEHSLLFLRSRGLKQYLRHQFNWARHVLNRETGRITQRFRPPETLVLLDQIYLLNHASERVYRPRPYPGRITYFYAAERERARPDSRLTWSEYAGEGLEVHLVPGDHTTMRFDPHVKVLADKMYTCLTRAQAGGGGSPAKDG